MTPNPQIIKSVEQLDYRVTVGDVAAKAGLELNFAQQGLLALASESGGHLQVAESGDVVYLFPKNFRSILRNKYWRLRWQKTWSKIWRVLFYIIRISFGVILVASILLMLVAIVAIAIAMSSANNDREGGIVAMVVADIEADFSFRAFGLGIFFGGSLLATIVVVVSAEGRLITTR